MTQQNIFQSIDFNKDNKAYIIEASAGTGKTWTIERLFIKALLENHSVNINNILVVTFTKIATNELKNRIFLQIINTIDYLQTQVQLNNKPHIESLFDNLCKDVSEDNKNKLDDVNDVDDFIKFLQQRLDISKDITRLTRAYQNFDTASIDTIHGFCTKILHDYPIECNISLPIKSIPHSNHQLYPIIFDFFRKFIINNPNLKHQIELVYKVLDFILEKNKNLDYIQKIINLLPNNKLLHYKNGAMRIKYKILAKPKLEYLIDPAWSEYFIVEEQKKIQALKNNKIFKKDSKDTLLNELKQNSLINLLSAVILYIEKNYSTTQGMDFNDQIEYVAHSLKHTEALRNIIRKTYPIAFIDEFQDTDLTQWEIFKTIYSVESIETITPNNKNINGILILVGDPKQSIYRFRGADINVYIQAKNIADTLSLNTNYRSNYYIVNFINVLFDSTNDYMSHKSIFGKNIYYNKNIAAIKNTQDIISSNTNKPVAVTDKINIFSESVQIVTIKAQYVDDVQNLILTSLSLEILYLLHNQPTLRGNIAILVSTNNELVLVAEYLKQYNIISSIMEQKNIFSLDISIELYTILNAINQTNNKNLLKLAISTNLLQYIICNVALADDRLNIIQEKLLQYKQIFITSGIMSMLFTFMRDLEISSSLNSIDLSADLINLQHLSEILHKQHKLTLNNLLYWFNLKLAIHHNNQKNYININHVIKNIYDTNNTNPEDFNTSNNTNEETVRIGHSLADVVILTQHKSKGLEYDVVFCPFFKSPKKIKTPEFVNFYDEYERAQYELSTDSTVTEIIYELECNEINRLNYVVLTRSKSKIYIYLKDTASKTSNRALINKLFASDQDGYNNNLFDYNKMFDNNINNNINNNHAILQQELLPDVVIYSRNNQQDMQIAIDILQNNISTNKEDMQQDATQNTKDQYNNCLLQQSKTTIKPIQKIEFDPQILTKLLKSSLKQQSYSKLIAKTLHCNTNTMNFENNLSANIHEAMTDIYNDYDINNNNLMNNTIIYEYPIFAELSGAKFGVFMHALFEKYPVNYDIIIHTMQKYGIDIKYANDVLSIINKIFTIPITHKLQNTQSMINNLHELQSNSIYELQFNLFIAKNVNLKIELYKILNKYLGSTHPYTIASNELNTNIYQGFLNGIIDVVFKFEHKYYILDYKTNIINHNELIIENAKHHYYLQYFIYLIALKRYLSFRLQQNDIDTLIGGAIYYYIRGPFIQNASKDFLYFNTNCQSIIQELDLLFI